MHHIYIYMCVCVCVCVCVYMHIYVCIYTHIYDFVCVLFSLKSILNLLQYCFCFTFLTARHVGFKLPNQGSNIHLLHLKVKS